MQATEPRVQPPGFGGLAAFAALVIAVALPFVPIVLAVGGHIDHWFESFRAEPSQDLVIAAVVVLLLTSDIVAPIPSTIVAGFAGLTLGPVVATVTIFTGLTIGCILGYCLADRLRRRLPAQSRLQHRIDRAVGRSPLVVVAVTRPIPLLGESSVLAAGLAQVRFRSFLLVVAPINAALALLFALVPERFV